MSLDKTFKKNIKLIIMSALTFTKTYIYQGSEMEAYNFSGSYYGKLRLPVVPIMFRVSYQFHSGKDKTIIDRDKEDVPMRPKPGF